MEREVVGNVCKVAIEDLQVIGFNPKARTTKGNIKSLKNSITRVGQLIPIVVTKDFVIVDGHRRYTAMKELGFDKIDVIFRGDDANEAPDLFVEINNNQRASRGKDAIEIALTTGILPSVGINAPIMRELVSIIGMEGLQVLYENKASPNILATAKMVSNYCKKDTSDKEWMATVILWLAVYKQQFAVRRAMYARIDREFLVETIRSESVLNY